MYYLPFSLGTSSRLLISESPDSPDSSKSPDSPDAQDAPLSPQSPDSSSPDALDSLLSSDLEITSVSSEALLSTSTSFISVFVSTFMQY